MLEQYKESKILVTGASGFIGSKLVRRLHDLGYKVRTLGRSSVPSSKFAGLNIEHFGGDITNPEQVSSAVHGCDIIFHLAGLVSYRKQDLQRQFSVNVLGTRDLLQAARKANVKRIIYTGSVAGMGIPPKGEIGTEEFEYNLQNKQLNYCDSKYEAEMHALNAFQDGVPVIILNPGIVFGEGDTHPHHHAIFTAMSKGSLIGVPGGGIPFADINDVVDAHINAMSMGRLGERYALVSANLTFKQAAAVFSKVSGARAPLFEIPGPLLVALGSFCENVLPTIGFKNPPLTKQGAWLCQHRIFFSSAKACHELNFNITPFEDTVRRTAPYYLGHA